MKHFILILFSCFFAASTFADSIPLLRSVLLVDSLCKSQQAGAGAQASIARNNMPEVVKTQFPAYTVKITDYGALNGGQKLCTEAINKAIDVVSAKGGGHVVIPSGLWLTGPIVLRSNVDLHLEDEALVVFSSDVNLYPVIETNYEGVKAMRCQSPISANNAENIAITGNGIFDGQGDYWRQVKRDKVDKSHWEHVVSSGGTVVNNGKTWQPEGDRMNIRPNMVKLTQCKRVLLQDATFKNSPCWCLHPLMCEDVILNGIKVYNPSYGQNGDALDVESCRRVVVENCVFDAGDDAICMKSGKNEEGRKRGIPTEDVIIRNCTVLHGHGGFVVGSEMSGGVRNIYVENCSFIGTDNGLRFKSTRGRGGLVDNIYIRNINMLDIVGNALIMDLYYWVDKNAKQPENPVMDITTPEFRNIHIKDISCKGAKKAIHINGLPESPLHDITIDNMVVTDAAQGTYINDAENITITNLTVETKGDFLKTGKIKNVSINGKRQ